MTAITIHLQSVFQWVLHASVQASIMVGLILALQWICRKWLNAKFQYCLWLLLIVRLALPWAPKSSISLYNFLPTVNDVQTRAVSADTASPALDTRDEPKPPDPVVVSASQDITIDKSIFSNALCGLWLLGVTVTAGWVCLSNILFWRRVRKFAPMTREYALQLLEECKKQMGIHTLLAVVETERVNTPVLFGMVRPRLLLPKGTLDSLDDAQLRHVFLHELAHLKRNDIVMGYVMTFLQSLHWFNPLVWYAFYRMRCDRELTCDGLALSNITEGESADYGRTIVYFLERFSQPCRLCSTAGVLEDQSQLKRRMKMIAKFSRPTYRWSFWAVALLVVVGMTALTNGQSAKKPNAKLNELQKAYEQWTTKTFGSFLSVGKFDDAPEEVKAWTGKTALVTMRKGKSAGSEYYMAINTLGELKYKRAVLPLLKIATEKTEKDNRDRWMATRALGLIGDKRATPKLIHLVYHYNQNTRIWAQISLVRLTGQNFGYDYKAWGKWWNGKRNKPVFKDQLVKWTTKYPEYADPAKQQQNDADFLKRIKESQSGKTQKRQKALRAKYNKRSAKDKAIYTPQQLHEIESLYQVANKKWRTQEAKDSLTKMLQKYDKANRTGCALLYMGQMSSGDEKAGYLLEAIKNHGDCYYGDGVNVGAYARLHLAGYYKSIGKTAAAVKLWKEILTEYRNAINHKGYLLRDAVTQQLKDAEAEL